MSNLLIGVLLSMGSVSVAQAGGALAQERRAGYSHNNMIETAIKIINTWWYPRNGMNPIAAR